MPDCRVLVIGSYGFFGRRLVQRLARNPSLHVIAAGRTHASAQALVLQLQDSAAAPLEAAAFDAQAPSFPDQLLQIRPDIVVNASGPFQGNDYRIPTACIAAGAHYIDLADGREYVSGIGALHQAACDARVLVTSGASSVPALSSAVCDWLARGLSAVSAIDIGISPGNRTERGLATVQGILSYCGKALPASRAQPEFGWSGSRRYRYPAPVGSRLLSPCDVPDLGLLPLRYAGHPQVRFGAGLELEFLHRGMNLMAWLARSGLGVDWSRHARPLKWMGDLFRTWGSDAGAMHVALEGTDVDGRPVRRTWHLLARNGDGPFVPTLAAAALVRKLQAGGFRTGAMPCVGLLSLADFEQEMAGLAIAMEADLSIRLPCIAA